MIKNLKTLDLFMLSLMIVSLPSVEAPKNFFLVGYLLTRIIFEFIEWKQRKIKWTHWDSIFLIFVLTAFLTTIYAGMPHLEEWKRLYGSFDSHSYGLAFKSSTIFAGKLSRSF